MLPIPKPASLDTRSTEDAAPAVRMVRHAALINAQREASLGVLATADARAEHAQARADEAYYARGVRAESYMISVGTRNTMTKWGAGSALLTAAAGILGGPGWAIVIGVGALLAANAASTKDPPWTR